MRAQKATDLRKADGTIPHRWWVVEREWKSLTRCEWVMIGARGLEVGNDFHVLMIVSFGQRDFMSLYLCIFRSGLTVE